MKERDICQTCGQPNKTIRHRQKCLAKSEGKIMSELRKNARAIVSKGLDKYGRTRYYYVCADPGCRREVQISKSEYWFRRIFRQKSYCSSECGKNV